MAIDVQPPSVVVRAEDEFAFSSLAIGAFVAGRTVTLGSSLAASWSTDVTSSFGFALSVVVACEGSADA